MITRGITIGILICLTLSVFAEKGDTLTHKKCVYKVNAIPDSSRVIKAGVIVEDTLVYEDFEEPEKVDTPKDGEGTTEIAAIGLGANFLEKADDKQMLVFPNPSVGEVTVKLNRFDDFTSATIRNHTGQIVLKLQGKISHVKYLSKGIYWVELHRLNHKEIQKLIVH